MHRFFFQSVKEPRQWGGSSGIMEARGQENGKLEKRFTESTGHRRHRRIGAERPLASENRKNHGLRMAI